MKKRLTEILLMMSLSFLTAVSSAEVNQASSTELRRMLFSLKSSELGVNPRNFPFFVWGVVMETGLTDGDYYTLAVLADGTVSLYVSNGGGIIGAGSHESVRSSAGRFLVYSEEFFDRGEVTTSYPPPSDNQVNFYFLTDEGNYMYSSPTVALSEGEDPLSLLFLAGHSVISELSEVAE
ncbi:hypothetical protein [Hahella ganghwensis]|uniref:hypothetical protein n=1 Tax=Hahella ganghwensis TaxID=286420 RepID=UPI0003762F3D|nr:hypothetical protein [Hahella ganghwensis]